VDRVRALLARAQSLSDITSIESELARREADLESLKAPLRPTFERAVAEVAADTGYTASGQTTWTFGTIDKSFTQTRAGHEVRGFPALVDEGSAAGLAVYGSADEADARHRLGVRRLLLLGLDKSGQPSPVKQVLDSLTNTEKLAVAGSPYPTVAELLEDCRAAVVQAVVDARPVVRDAAAFDGLLEAVADEPVARLRAVFDDVMRALEAWRRTDKLLSGRADMVTLPALTDMKAQLGRLFERGFVAEAGVVHLRHYPRYCAAIDYRRSRLDGQVNRDRQLMDQIGDLQQAWLNRVAALPSGRPVGADLRAVRWLLEEYRVSLFAQQLGTAQPVSDARIRKLLDGA